MAVTNGFFGLLTDQAIQWQVQTSTGHGCTTRSFFDGSQRKIVQRLLSARSGHEASSVHRRKPKPIQAIQGPLEFLLSDSIEGLD